jgi:membrane protease subunit HflK
MNPLDPNFSKRLSPDVPNAGDPRREASVNFRGPSDVADEQTLLDPANQSLADAIRITFRILQLGMVVLFGLYLLSGFQMVKEGEHGIRLLFGKIETGRLDPGFRFSWPYPFGELVKIKKGANELRVDDSFWVDVPAGTPRDTSVDKLNAQFSLKPAEKSGSLLTADGSIAHTRVVATYRREEASQYAANVLPDQEEKLVREVVKRCIVIATAETSIDEFLKPSEKRESVAARARALAQQMLNDLKSGIQIDALSLDQPIAPLALKADFAKKETAVSNRGRAIDDANAAANQILSAAAGRAAPYLVAAINEYEAAVDAADNPRQAQALAKVDALLEGKPVEMNGTIVEGLSEGGRVIQMLSEANTFRSQIKATRKQQLTLFDAKLQQFKANPLVMVNREWSDALAKFYSKESVQMMFTPVGQGQLQLVLNADPDIVRELDRVRKRDEAEASQRERQRKQDEERFRTKTDLQTVPG